MRPILITLALAIAAAAPISHAQTAQFFKDEGITLRVVAKLQFNKQLFREKIDVKTNQGIVTLAGNVSSAELVKLAGSLAAEVSGVTKVVNALQVGPPLRDEPPGGA